MKNQYVGDVNDFQKYALLRRLADAHGSRLVVCWMLTPGDDGSDGSLTAYLSQPDTYRHVDVALFDALAALIARGDRSVEAIDHAGLFPGALFVSDVLPDDRDARERYFDDLVTQLRPNDLVFFDPDNGFEIKSRPKGRKGSSKFLFWDEWARVAQLGCSTCVYQHFGRIPRQAQIAALLERSQQLAPDHAVACVYTPRVAYLLAIAEDRADAVLGEVQVMADELTPALQYLEEVTSAGRADAAPELYDAVGNFLAYASDQCAHLEDAGVEGILYVGRRLDQAWRWLDLAATRYLGERYQDVPHSRVSRDLSELEERLAELPSLAQVATATTLVALEHLDAAARLVSEMDQDDCSSIAVAMHLARRQYSAYRVAKYQCVEKLAGDLDEERRLFTGYQRLEA